MPAPSVAVYPKHPSTAVCPLCDPFQGLMAEDPVAKPPEVPSSKVAAKLILLDREVTPPAGFVQDRGNNFGKSTVAITLRVMKAD